MEKVCGMNTSWALVPVFAPGLYTCTMTLQPTTNQQTRLLSVSMTNLLVKAGLVGSIFTGEQVSTQLPIEPGLYSDQTELLLSNLHPSAEFTVYGPPAVLSTIEVRSGSGKMHHNITLCQQVDVRKHILLSLGDVHFSQSCRLREGGPARIPQLYEVHC